MLRPYLFTGFHNELELWRFKDEDHGRTKLLRVREREVYANTLNFPHSSPLLSWMGWS